MRAVILERMGWSRLGVAEGIWHGYRRQHQGEINLLSKAQGIVSYYCDGVGQALYERTDPSKRGQRRATRNAVSKRLLHLRVGDVRVEAETQTGWMYFVG